MPAPGRHERWRTCVRPKLFTGTGDESSSLVLVVNWSADFCDHDRASRSALRSFLHGTSLSAQEVARDTQQRLTNLSQVFMYRHCVCPDNVGRLRSSLSEVIVLRLSARVLECLKSSRSMTDVLSTIMCRQREVER